MTDMNKKRKKNGVFIAMTKEEKQRLRHAAGYAKDQIEQGNEEYAQFRSYTKIVSIALNDFFENKGKELLKAIPAPEEKANGRSK